MKTIKIFIASSDEVKKEREELEKLINEKNLIYHDYGIYLKPEMWELQSRSFSDKRKQNEYTERLLDSDIAIFIFGIRIGEHTKEEFNIAYKNMKNRKKPHYIFTYFKNVNVNSRMLKNRQLSELKKGNSLQNYIMKTLQQVYDYYVTIDEIKLKVENEINRILLPEIYRKNNDILKDKKINDFIDIYNGITEAFQVNFKNTIIDSAINQLYLLKKYDIKPKLSQLSKSDYYDLCQALIKDTQSGSKIKALSLMLKCEWTNSPEEVNFWKANVDAVKRDVLLERIFIVKKKEEHRLAHIPQIVNHMNEKNDFLKAYVIQKETLLNFDNKLLKDAGKGFLLVDDKNNRVALLDEDSENGMRGTPIFDETDLEKLDKTFDKIKKLSVPLDEYIKNVKLSHHKKEMLSIFVTTECNLNCDYCFTNKHVGNHKNQTIDIEFVKKGIDEYFKSEYIRHIRFFGAGEPTVKLNIIKETCKYAVEKGGDAVTFEIQTNGAFDDDTAEWLSKNINIIWISCDGTPDIQDAHRLCIDKNKKSSELIKKNIEILKNGNCFVGIRSTITDENVDRQIEMIDYFKSIGINTIWVDPIFPGVGDKEESNFDHMKFAKKFLEACCYAEKENVFYGSILTCNFGDTVTTHCRACLPVPHLTTDGYVSACDMALFGNDSNHMDPFIYGKWDQKRKTIDLYDDKISKLQSRNTENMSHCKKCSSKEHCGGYCLGEVLNETRDLFGKKKGVCEAIRFLDSHMNENQRKYLYTHP